MKTLLVCLSFTAVLLVWPHGHAAHARRVESQECRLAVAALDAASKLKAGMLRADIERSFETDGGMSFQDQTTYTYKYCYYIKLDIEFQKRELPPNAPAFSRDDIISKVSRPYLAYPVTD